MPPENHMASNLSDERLLILLSGKSESAFRELYQRYWVRLYTSARRVLRDEKSAEDVVQEVFIDLWKKDSYGHIENFSAYLHQAVRFKTLMALRKNKISDHHLAVYREIVPENVPNQELQFSELQEEIAYHLEQLPPRCREIFYKSRFEHMKNQEIADQLNISKRTVETHISNALRYLKGVRELLSFLLSLGIWWFL